MSRTGKKVIPLAAGVTVKMDGTMLEVRGPKGTLKRETFGRIAIALSNNILSVSPLGEENARAYWGLYRSLLKNMVDGVSTGFTQALEIQGTGYRASMAGKVLNLSVGFSHPVNIDPPNGILFEVDKTGKVIVSGLDKELVGQTAASIRAVRPVEPYREKGIRYLGEKIKTKVGKSASAKK